MKSVGLDEKIHAKARVKCAKLGVKISDVANSLFEKWLKGEIKYEIKYKQNKYYVPFSNTTIFF